MISKLSSAKNFGVFEDFVWPSGLTLFERRTLIYGWNYSGKTTLSRIFRCFESKTDHPDYPEATASLLLSDGRTVSSTTYPSDLHVRVFNSDFIRDNLKWEEGLKPILILGVEHIELTKKLAETNSAITAAEATRSEMKRDRSALANGLEKRMTEVARTIGEITGERNYKRPSLQATVAKLGQGYADRILTESEYDLARQRFNSNEKKDEVEKLAYGPPDIQSLRIEAQNKLEATVRSRVLDRLRDEPSVSGWVREGLPLHENRTHCLFCEGKLSDDLIEKLTAHFSKEFESLVTELETLSTRINQSRRKPPLPPRESFYTDLQLEYKNTTSELLRDFGDVEQRLDLLVQSINDKKKNVFQSMQCPECSTDTSVLTARIEKLNGIIHSHNTRTAQFEEERKKQAELIEQHLVASYIRDEDYYGVMQQVALFDSGIETSNKALLELEEGKREIESKISEEVKGAERINEYLRSFFSKDDLEVVVQGRSYQLRRGKSTAKNLSEGERTAIAFAYFIASLENKDTKLDETVVFVDDPISSLDANHVYNTYAFIRQRLGNCTQLFLSTHNAEFFNLIKTWFKDEQKKQKWTGYLTERVSVRSSVIVQMPDELVRFKSEYHYLFSILYRFSTNVQADFHYLFQLPNLVRRFLEAFAGFTIPTHDSLEKKLVSLMPDATERYRIYKFINEYSHNGTLERTLTLPVLQECQAIVQIALDAARQRDAVHYEHMVEEVSQKNQA